MIDLDREQYLRNIGYNIRVVRQMRNLTQEQLADIIGVTQAQIARIESGAVNPRLFTIALLAKGLSVSYDKILGDKIDFTQ